MKKHAVFVGAMILAAGSGVAASMSGCGSDDAPPPPLSDNGETPVPNGGTDAAANNNNNNNNNPQDSGTNNPTGDGGPTNTGDTAGKITCGSTDCNASTEACCTAAFALDGGDPSSCKPKAESCGFGSKSVCDEAADCAAGEFCCRSIAGASCEKTKCGFGAITLCKTAAECGDAGACSEYTCGKQKVSACSKPPTCN